MCGPKVPVVPGHCATMRANYSPISLREDDTSLYLVEHELAGSTWKQVVAIHEEITRVCAQQQADGVSVDRVRSIFLPGQGRCLCLFEAANAETVGKIAQATQLLVGTVVNAVEVQVSQTL